MNPFIKYQLVIVPNYYYYAIITIITTCGDFLIEFPLLRKQKPMKP